MAQNPLLAGGYYPMSDIYGNTFSRAPSTAENTAPETSEQESLSNMESATVSPTNPNHKNILLWLGGVVLFIALFQMKGLRPNV